MSWWTNFRDAALTGAGLKKGRNAAKTLGSVARPTFKSATQPTPQPASALPAQAVGFSPSQFMRDNKWVGIAIMAGGGLMLYKAKTLK